MLADEATRTQDEDDDLVIPVGSLPPEGWWPALRRVVVLAVAAVVMLAGAVNITATITRWVASRPAPAPPAPTVSDTQLAGFAAVAATDYLSWDSSDRPARQTALARYASPGAAIDGWNGTGREFAFDAATIGITRGGTSRAVATVRVQVMPLSSAPGATVPMPSDAGGNVASAPTVLAQGAAGASRWVNLAVPVEISGGQLSIPAEPALVGSPPPTAEDPAVADASATEDATFAQSTQDTVTMLLSSYGTGDLSYSRAAGTTYSGLGGAATVQQLRQWRVAPVAPGADASRRRGDATVTWALSGGAGQLTCSYVVDLQAAQGRWYLAGVSAETAEVTGS